MSRFKTSYPLTLPLFSNFHHFKTFFFFLAWSTLYHFPIRHLPLTTTTDSAPLDRVHELPVMVQKYSVITECMAKAPSAPLRISNFQQMSSELDRRTDGRDLNISKTGFLFIPYWYFLCLTNLIYRLFVFLTTCPSFR